MLRIGTTILGLLLLAGCNGRGPLFADLQYATRCDNTGSCPEGSQNRDICGFNDMDPCDEARPDARLSCDVNEDESTRTIRFSATQGGDFFISVEGLVVPFAGGSAQGGACNVTIVEGANTYAGACGGSPPSEAQPCQITEVAFFDDMGNPTVEGQIFCQFLANRTNPTLKLEVTAIGSSPNVFNEGMSECDTRPTAAACMPGRFRFANCDGLNVTP